MRQLESGLKTFEEQNLGITLFPKNLKPGIMEHHS